jgi:phosphoesterase RecJ-like protein
MTEERPFVLPFHRAAVALRKASTVIVCAHVRPDGDAVGSVLGMTLALRAAGIPAVPTLADDRPAPSTYSFLPGHSLYVPAIDLDPPSVFVALDTPVADRLGGAEGLMSEAGSTIVFDHHPGHASYGDICVCDPSMAATGQIIWRFLAPLGIAPTPDIALPLYVALMSDTGRFGYDNTSPDALRDAADMLEVDVDPAYAARMVYQERSAASLEIEARAVTRLTVANDSRVAWTYLTDVDFADTGALPEEAEHVIDATRALAGVDVVVLLRQKGSEVRGNLRSKTGVDVSAVASAFGGGGHRAAAGFTVADASVDSVIASLLPMLPGGGGE